MIKANELRVGNLLNYDTAENDIVVATIDWQDIQWISQDPKGFNLVHTPITLTEERLTKLMFRKSGHIFWISLFNLKAELHIEIYQKENVITIESDFGRLILDPIRYVHQLQNLYFALTGEELETKGGNNG